MADRKEEAYGGREGRRLVEFREETLENLKGGILVVGDREETLWGSLIVDYREETWGK